MAQGVSRYPGFTLLGNYYPLQARLGELRTRCGVCSLCEKVAGCGGCSLEIRSVAPTAKLLISGSLGREAGSCVGWRYRPGTGRFAPKFTSKNLSKALAFSRPGGFEKAADQCHPDPAGAGEGSAFRLFSIR